jgi:hypothetical protein
MDLQGLFEHITCGNGLIIYIYSVEHISLQVVLDLRTIEDQVRNTRNIAVERILSLALAVRAACATLMPHLAWQMQ